MSTASVLEVQYVPNPPFVRGLRVVPFERSHFTKLRVRPLENLIKDSIQLTETEWAQTIKDDAVEAYTVFLDDELFFIGGLSVLWAGVGEVWVVGTPIINNNKKSFFKLIKYYLNYFIKKYELKRCQAQVQEWDGMEPYLRFAKRIGFKFEGRLHNYCGGSINNLMFAIWE